MARLQRAAGSGTVASQRAVAAAANERDRSYKSRDHAYRVLWALAQLHNETYRSERCSCGKQLASCQELTALGQVENSLRRWEDKQVERLRRDEHPRGEPARRRASAGRCRKGSV